MPASFDDEDMETVDGLKLTKEPTDRVVERIEVVAEGEVRPSDNKPGTLEIALSMVERITRTDAKKDAMQFDRTVTAMEGTITGQRVVILFLVVVLAMVIAGVTGVGVTGKLPGGYEIEIQEAP